MDAIDTCSRRGLDIMSTKGLRMSMSLLQPTTTTKWTSRLKALWWFTLDAETSPDDRIRSAILSSRILSKMSCNGLTSTFATSNVYYMYAFFWIKAEIWIVIILHKYMWSDRSTEGGYFWMSRCFCKELNIKKVTFMEKVDCAKYMYMGIRFKL